MNQNNRLYPQYPEYKASNVEWIKEIPKHWDVWKTTHGFNLIGSGTTPKSDNSEYYNGEINWITTSELRENEIFESRQKITDLALEDYSALELYPSDSIIIAMYGATIGRLGILKTNSTVNQACCVFSEPKAFNEKFFFYWLQYRKSILISLSVGGGQPNLSQDDLKSLRVPLPPLPEQKAIATFLDHQTTRIDQLIEKKKRILELLDEQRQATITRSVTKGIDPNAKMKDSGIEWLGEVPEHWDITKIKRLTSKIGSGKTPKGGSNIYVNDGVLFLRSQNIHFDGLRLEDAVFIPEEIDADMKNTRVIEGDLLLNITGASLGRVCLYSITDTKANVNQHVCIIRISKHLQIDRRFVLFGLISKALQYQIFSSENGTSREGLNFEQVGSLLITLPPVEEQKEIADYLSENVNKIDHLKSKIELALDHLEEYRSSLITQAVTGKIDVRDEVSKQELSYAAEEGEAYTTN